MQVRLKQRLWKHLGLITVAILAVLFFVVRVHAQHNLEARALQGASTLHRIVSIDSNNFKLLEAVYFPNRRAMCFQYQNMDNLGQRYIRNAVLLDGEDRITYELDGDDAEWLASCGPGWDSNIKDLRLAVREEDR